MHQQEAQELSSYHSSVPVTIVDRSGHALSLSLVGKSNSGHTALDIFDFGYLLLGVCSIRCRNILITLCTTSSQWIALFPHKPHIFVLSPGCYKKNFYTNILYICVYVYVCVYILYIYIYIYVSV